MSSTDGLSNHVPFLNDHLTHRGNEIKPEDLGNVQSGVSGTFLFCFLKGPSTDLTLHAHAVSVYRAALIWEDMLDAHTQGTGWNGNNRALVEVSLKAGRSPAPRAEKPGPHLCIKFPRR